MTYSLEATNRFKKQANKLFKGGKDKQKLKRIIEILVSGIPIPKSYRDHQLKGNLSGRQELHIEYDWLLIYMVNHETKRIILDQTGTHADLFN